MIDLRMGKKFLMLVVLLAWLVGCNQVTPGLTPSVTVPATITSEAYGAPYPVSTPLFPANTSTIETYPPPLVDITPPVISPLPSTTGSVAGTEYPGPEVTQATPILEVTSGYPEPVQPGGTISPQPTQSGELTTTPYPNPVDQPTQGNATPHLDEPTKAVGEITPTTFIPQYQPTPVPGQFTTIKIWHSWSGSQVQVLEQAIQVFQAMEPSVSFDLLYFPFDELAGKYEAEAYRGEGPTLLIGDSEWLAGLSKYNLVKDLSPYISTEFVETLSSPAYRTVQIEGHTLALPFAMRGVVLYRNKQLVPEAPSSFDELLGYGKQATQGGNVGLYLDWGCYFSCAQMQGLGGSWLDDRGQIQFDSGDYQTAMVWLAQLQQIQASGSLIEFNQDRAVNLFKLGKIGMTIDGSWRAWELARAIGEENLAIDLWPLNGTGRMAGYVQTEVLFLNSTVAERSLVEEQAALRFMGLLLTPEVQLRLAEVGFIPTVMKTRPQDIIKINLMASLNSGVAFPPAWQGEIRQAYWASIDAAAQSVIERGVPAHEALETAAKEIDERLRQISNR